MVMHRPRSRSPDRKNTASNGPKSQDASTTVPEKRPPAVRVRRRRRKSSGKSAADAVPKEQASPAVAPKADTSAVAAVEVLSGTESGGDAEFLADSPTSDLDKGSKVEVSANVALDPRELERVKRRKERESRRQELQQLLEMREMSIIPIPEKKCESGNLTRLLEEEAKLLQESEVRRIQHDEGVQKRRQRLAALQAEVAAAKNHEVALAAQIQELRKQIEDTRNERERCERQLREVASEDAIAATEAATAKSDEVAAKESIQKRVSDAKAEIENAKADEVAAKEGIQKRVSDAKTEIEKIASTVQGQKGNSGPGNGRDGHDSHYEESSRKGAKTQQQKCLTEAEAVVAQEGNLATAVSNEKTVVKRPTANVSGPISAAFGASSSSASSSEDEVRAGTEHAESTRGTASLLATPTAGECQPARPCATVAAKLDPASSKEEAQHAVDRKIAASAAFGSDTDSDYSEDDSYKQTPQKRSDKKREADSRSRRRRRSRDGSRSWREDKRPRDRRIRGRDARERDYDPRRKSRGEGWQGKGGRGDGRRSRSRGNGYGRTGREGSPRRRQEDRPRDRRSRDRSGGWRDGRQADGDHRRDGERRRDSDRTGKAQDSYRGNRDRDRRSRNRSRNRERRIWDDRRSPDHRREGVRCDKQRSAERASAVNAIQADIPEVLSSSSEKGVPRSDVVVPDLRPDPKALEATSQMSAKDAPAQSVEERAMAELATKPGTEAKERDSLAQAVHEVPAPPVEEPAIAEPATKLVTDAKERESLVQAVHEVPAPPEEEPAIAGPATKLSTESKERESLVQAAHEVPAPPAEESAIAEPATKLATDAKERESLVQAVHEVPSPPEEESAIAEPATKLSTESKELESLIQAVHKVASQSASVPATDGTATKPEQRKHDLAVVEASIREVASQQTSSAPATERTATKLEPEKNELKVVEKPILEVPTATAIEQYPYDPLSAERIAEKKREDNEVPTATATEQYPDGPLPASDIQISAEKGREDNEVQSIAHVEQSVDNSASDVPILTEKNAEDGEASKDSSKKRVEQDVDRTSSEQEPDAKRIRKHEEKGNDSATRADEISAEDVAGSMKARGSTIENAIRAHAFRTDTEPPIGDAPNSDLSENAVPEKMKDAQGANIDNSIVKNIVHSKPFLSKPLDANEAEHELGDTRKDEAFAAVMLAFNGLTSVQTADGASKAIAHLERTLKSELHFCGQKAETIQREAEVLKRRVGHRFQPANDAGGHQAGTELPQTTKNPLPDGSLSQLLGNPAPVTDETRQSEHLQCAQSMSFQALHQQPTVPPMYRESRPMRRPRFPFHPQPQPPPGPAPVDTPRSAICPPQPPPPQGLQDVVSDIPRQSIGGAGSDMMCGMLQRHGQGHQPRTYHGHPASQMHQPHMQGPGAQEGMGMNQQQGMFPAASQFQHQLQGHGPSMGGCNPFMQDARMNPQMMPAGHGCTQAHLPFEQMQNGQNQLQNQLQNVQMQHGQMQMQHGQMQPPHMQHNHPHHAPQMLQQRQMQHLQHMQMSQDVLVPQDLQQMQQQMHQQMQQQQLEQHMQQQMQQQQMQQHMPLQQRMHQQHVQQQQQHMHQQPMQQQMGGYWPGHA